MQYVNDYLSFLEQLAPIERQLSQISEGLIMTHDIKKSIKILKTTLLKEKLVNFSIIEKNKSIVIEFNKFNNELLKDIFYSKIEKLITNLGYYISHYIIETDNNFKTVANQPSNLTLLNSDKIYIYLNKKYDFPYDLKGKYLYHVTFRYLYENKIKKQGLIPKSLNLLNITPERIYLTDDNKILPYFMEHKIKLMKDKNLFKKHELQNKLYGQYTIIKIDITKIKSLKLMEDVYTDNGLYTCDNIPNYSIVNIKHFEF